MIKKLLLLLLRWVCYAGLLYLLSGVVALMATQGHCPRFDTGAIQCDSPWAQDWAGYAMGVTLVTAFTGVPLLLALGALIFIGRDLLAWRRRRRAAASPAAER